MTIIQRFPMEGTDYHPLQSQSHRQECWLEGYVAVPEHLVDVAFACKGYCDLQVQDQVVVNLVPKEPPGTEPTEPTAEEDRDSLLIDVLYRVTLLELGVI